MNSRFKSQTPNYTNGFTLFEVLVSIAILSIAIVVVLQLFSANMRNISKSDEYVKATIKAESMMREVLDGELKEGTFMKRTDDGYNVEVSIKDKDDKRMMNLPVKLLDISLNLKWSDGIKERVIRLNTMKVVAR
ncbi:MAG: hypothetical protein Fur0020_09110 [Thermodesulfovibrionia bacterium]